MTPLGENCSYVATHPNCAFTSSLLWRGLFNYSSSLQSHHRSGGLTPFDTSFLTLGKGDNVRRSDLTGAARMIAISKDVAYLVRRGAERGVLKLDKQGFVLFRELLKIHEPIRKMRAIESDIMNIEDGQTAEKRRIRTRWDDAQLYVRTYQGHIAASTVDVTQDPENQLLTRPGYLLRSMGPKPLRGIPTEGLRKMQRNAIHLIPSEFSARQSLYIQRQKTPFSLLIDGDAAGAAGCAFYQSPHEVAICDGGVEGVVDKRFLVSLYDYDVANHRVGFNRLSMKAAIDGIKPAQPFSEEPDDITGPKQVEEDYNFQSRSERDRPKIPAPPTLGDTQHEQRNQDDSRRGSPQSVRAKYGPSSFAKPLGLSEGNSGAPIQL